MIERRRRDRPERGVTAEQRRTLSVVASLTLLNGQTPTLSQVAKVLRVSKEAVFYRLRWMEKKGLWCGRRRSIEEPGVQQIVQCLRDSSTLRSAL